MFLEGIQKHEGQSNKTLERLPILAPSSINFSELDAQMKLKILIRLGLDNFFTFRSKVKYWNGFWIQKINLNLLSKTYTYRVFQGFSKAT